MKRVVSVMLVLSCLLGLGGVTAGWCGDDASPDIYTYAWRGFAIGTLTGLSAGYIRYADSNDTNNMAKSGAYGALIGLGLGLIGGALDITYLENGYINEIERDMYYGGPIGAALGLVWGGIDMLNRNDSKVLGPAVSWGYISGVVIGAAYGIYKNETEGPSAKADQDVRYSYAMLSDSEGNAMPYGQLSYRFK